MSILTAAELASIQADVSGLWDNTCTIMRLSRTDDGEGGSAEIWTAVATAPCLVVDAISPAEQTVALQNLGKIGKKILMPMNTDVIQTDQIKIGTETFRIIGLYDPTSVQIVKQALVTQEVQ